MSEPQEISNTPAEQAPETYLGFQMRTIVEHVLPVCLVVICLTIVAVSARVHPAAIVSGQIFGIALYTLGVLLLRSTISRRELLLADPSPHQVKNLSRFDSLLWLLQKYLLPISFTIPVTLSVGISIGTPWRNMLVVLTCGLCMTALMGWITWYSINTLSRK